MKCKLGKILSAFVQTNTPFFVKVKSTDQTKTLDTTIAIDDELKFNARSNQTYFIELYIIWEADVTPDIKYNLVIPSGAAALRFDDSWDSTLAQTLLDWETAQNFNGGAFTAAQPFWGRVVMGVTAGDVGLGWAQNTSNAADTKVLAGSFLRVYEA